jgi:hypothetical protein
VPEPERGGAVKVAYADPPYPGQSAKHYADHPDFAGEVDHKALIKQLERDFPDGWALSTGAKNLQDVLALCPPVRVLIWKKPGTPFGDKFIWSWEPVLLRGCRRPSEFVRDMVDAMPLGQMVTFRARPGEDVTGSKPDAFCRWLFQAMGLQPDDEFHDLFPGSGAVRREWEAWRAQSTLEAA